ncbi:MAG: tetratricopeptide repeat protein [Acidobacteriota bacterium]
MTKKPGPSVTKEAERRILRQLDHVLASATFQQVDRLKRFLNFVVTETAAGRGDDLKEYVVGVQVFSKDESFDPRTDPVVRVQARRLRARLERYYRDEGQSDEWLIELPKGGYAPQFVRRETLATPKRTASTVLASRNSVAVLPFLDLSGTQNLEYFCRGLRDEIIHRLTKLQSLRVSKWNPTGPATGDTQRELAQSGAATVISGSVRASGNTVRVTTHLLDSASGCYLWSESTDAGLADVLESQDKVAQALVTRLQSELSGPIQSRVGRQTTTNLAAHNLYLQGRFHLSQRTEEGLRKAVDFFERALVEDAQYALAHSGLSDAYGLLAHYGVLGPAEVWTKAASSAASAVMLDPGSVEGHTSLAHTKSTQDWDWHGAEQEFLCAIGLDPRYATAHHWYAMSCLAPLGRLDEALEQMLLAQSLDPVSSIIARDVAVVHHYRRDFDAALDQCDHTIELNPHFSAAYWTLGLIQEQRKDFDEAEAAFQRASHLSPQSPRMKAALARIYALTGRRKAALAVLAELETLAATRYVSPFDFASIHFALQQSGPGFRWLNKACEDRCFELISIKVDPRFDALREDRRFTALARQVGVG